MVVEIVSRMPLFELQVVVREVENRRFVRVLPLEYSSWNQKYEAASPITSGRDAIPIAPCPVGRSSSQRRSATSAPLAGMVSTGQRVDTAGSMGEP